MQKCLRAAMPHREKNRAFTNQANNKLTTAQTEMERSSVNLICQHNPQVDRVDQQVDTKRRERSTPGRERAREGERGREIVRERERGRERYIYIERVRVR